MELVLTQDKPNEREGTLREPDLVFAWRSELDSYYTRLRNFSELEPDEVFRELSAMSARISEIRTYLVRMQSRMSQSFRTQEIDYFLQEVDRQFKLHSRIQSFRTLDYEMTRGV